MHNFVYLSLYVKSQLKLSIKTFLIIFYNSLFIKEDGDLNSSS